MRNHQVYEGDAVEDIILYGSGGMARELSELIEDINIIEPVWHIVGYLNDTITISGGEKVDGYSILGGGDILKNIGGTKNVVLAMSNPAIKLRIYQKIKDYDIRFPILIHPTARIARNVKIGEGSVIGMDCIVSVNACLGRHVFLNMRTVIGHDAIIDDFSSCLVNCIVAGNVHVKEGCLLGSNCVVMEKKVIGNKAKIGMGAIVCFDVDDQNVVMSRPSKSMYFGKPDE